MRAARPFLLGENTCVQIAECGMAEAVSVGHLLRRVVVPSRSWGHPVLGLGLARLLRVAAARRVGIATVSGRLL